MEEEQAGDPDQADRLKAAGMHNVADADSLAPGRARTVEVGGRRLTLVNVDGQFHTLDDGCPHRGTSLGAGYLEGCVLHCPLHGWGFDVQTGACDVRPDKPVRTYPTEVRDGKVWVALESGPAGE